MYLGATTWTFSWAPPYDEALKTIARLGFKGAELTIWGEDFLRDYYTPETNKHLRSLIADLGLVLSSVFCIPVGIGSTDPKQGGRGRSIQAGIGCRRPTRHGQNHRAPAQSIRH